MEKVRFGIVGCGNMGTGHARNIAAGKVINGTLAALCDNNPKKLEKVKEVYGDSVKYFDDAETMFASGEVDCVIICVPHYDHPSLAIKALDNDINCIVEKPAGVYTLQVEEMMERAKKSDKVLGIMFNQRTNPLFRMMKKMIAEGKIGEVKRTNWIITDWYRSQYYYDSGEWRATWVGEGGGVLYNQAPHQLDLFQWIVGMMPSKVHAHCHFGKWHNIEVEDDVTCYCEYPNGATGVFVTCTADAPGTNRFEVTGTRGTLVCEHNKLYYTELKIDEREHCFSTDAGFKPPEAYPTVEIESEEVYTGHYGICNNIANTILGLEEIYAPATDGICGVELANAMLLSTWIDGPVSLPIDGKFFYEELKKRIATSKPRAPIDEVIVQTQG